MSYIGLDVGFTGVKSVIFSGDAKIISSAYFDYGPGYKRDLLYKNEIDPLVVLAGVKKVLISCRAKALKDRPRTISVSVSGDDLFPADKNGAPIYNVLSAYNQNPTRYRKDILNKLGSSKKIFNMTGQVIETDVLGLPRILWLVDNIPGLLKRTWKFLCWESYINYYFTGYAVTDYSNTSRFLTFDIFKNQWSGEILDKFNLSIAQMPAAEVAGSPVGRIKKDVADELDLPSDIMVLAGAFDQAAAAFGAGVLDEGIFSLGMGTVLASHWVLEGVEKIKSVKKGHYPYCSYLDEGKVMGLFCNFNGSNIITWFFDSIADLEKEKYGSEVFNFYNSGIDSYPSKLFFLPHFTGAGYPVNDVKSKGSFIGLDLKTDKKEIIKAVYEGISFELKLNYNDLATNTGFKISQIRAVGGSSRAKIWLQILSNVLNKNIITLKIDEGGCLACAILGAVYIGDFKNLKEGMDNFIKAREIIEPEKEKVKLFEEKFRQHKKLYYRLKELNQYISDELLKIHQKQNWGKT